MSSLLLSLLLVLIPCLDAGSQCKVCESFIMKNGASDETFRIVLPVENACADAPVIECSENEFCFFANRDLRLVYSDGQRATEEASRIDLKCMVNEYLEVSTCATWYDPDYPLILETFEVTMNQCEVKIDGDIPSTALGLPESDSGSDQTADSGSDQTDSGSDQTDSGSDQTDSGSDQTDPGDDQTDADKTDEKASGSDSSVPVAGGIKCHSCITITAIGADGSETEAPVTEEDGSTPAAACSAPTTEACLDPQSTSCSTITLTYTMQDNNIRQVTKACSLTGMSCELLKSQMSQSASGMEVTDCDIRISEPLAEEDGDKDGDKDEDSQDNDGGNKTGEEPVSNDTDQDEAGDEDNEYNVVIVDPKEEAAKSSASNTTYFLSLILVVPLSSLLNLW